MKGSHGWRGGIFLFFRALGARKITEMTKWQSVLEMMISFLGHGTLSSLVNFGWVLFRMEDFCWFGSSIKTAGPCVTLKVLEKKGPSLTHLLYQAATQLGALAWFFSLPESLRSCWWKCIQALWSIMPTRCISKPCLVLLIVVVWEKTPLLGDTFFLCLFWWWQVFFPGFLGGTIFEKSLHLWLVSLTIGPPPQKLPKPNRKPDHLPFQPPCFSGVKTRCEQLR